MEALQEKILEIMRDGLHGRYYADEKTAKEITTLIEKDYYEKEFVEWLDFGNHPFVPWWDSVGTKIENYYTDEISPKHFTLNELHQYWMDNMKGK